MADGRHHAGGAEPATRHVADHEDGPRAVIHDLVPVAADLRTGDARRVADGDLQPRDRRQLARQQALLQGHRRGSLLAVELGDRGGQALGLAAAVLQAGRQQRGARGHRDAGQRHEPRERGQQRPAEDPRWARSRSGASRRRAG